MRTIRQHDPQTPRLQSQALGKGADDLASLSEQNREALLSARQSGRTRARGHHPFDLVDCRRQPRARLAFSAAIPRLKIAATRRTTDGRDTAAVRAICVFGNTA